MSTTIQVLPDETINKIAAGEVIENPASVIKELVENGVDAGASRIIVEMSGGGFQEICVSDNGKGMNREDLLLCLERHATSKIRKAQDLHSVLSMGFRGEALASIASISKMTVTTCQKQEAHTLYAEGGKIRSIREAARNPGTTVQVRSLFYNVPARRKFQKSVRSCQSESLKMLTKLALAHPFLEIKCLADGKEVFSSFMKRLDDREKVTRAVIEKVLGPSFLEGTSRVAFEDKGCTVWGWIGAAHQTRKNRTGQYLFINGRAVISPQMTRAIYEGYGTRLPSNEHPTFVLHVTLPTEWVDVNVHPQKKEVRLGEDNQIEGVIRQGVFQALQGFEASPEPREIPSPVSWSAGYEPTFQLREEETDLPPLLPSLMLPVIGLYAHYLLLDADEKGVLWVDLQAAEARLCFEALLEHFEGKGEMQTLLFPVTLELRGHEKASVDMHLKTLHEMGVGIRPFGENTFVVDAIDPHFEEEKIAPLIHELLDVLERFGDTKHVEKEKQKKLALTALRFARSQKSGYTLEQARTIVRQLFKTDTPLQGPTGKPIGVYFSSDDIKKHFH